MTETEKIVNRVCGNYPDITSIGPYHHTRTPRVIVVVEGGLVTGILANGDGIEVAVIDYDTDDAGENDEIVHIPQTGSETAPAFASVRCVETAPERVAQLFAAIEGRK